MEEDGGDGSNRQEEEGTTKKVYGCCDKGHAYDGVTVEDTEDIVM